MYGEAAGTDLNPHPDSFLDSSTVRSTPLLIGGHQPWLLNAGIIININIIVIIVIIINHSSFFIHFALPVFGNVYVILPCLLCQLWLSYRLTGVHKLPRPSTSTPKTPWGVCCKVFEGKQKSIKFSEPCTSQYHVRCLQISEEGYTYCMDSDTSTFKCMIYIKSL
jgi:hypothetical protein